MPTRIVWIRRPAEALGELVGAYSAAIEQGIVEICQRYVPQIENWMRTNAPWTDRTGNARQGLYANVEQVVRRMVAIEMGHGVDYGFWLEVRWSGRYAVVDPALDYFAPLIWRDIVRMLS